MEYRQLGRTGVKVSPVCLGAMMFGWKTSLAESFDIIDAALDAGVNFIDTANVYSRGQSEEVVGEALKRNQKRDKVILATKVHGRMDDDDPNAEGNSRRHIIEQCEASLRRLKTDWIDLYQIHRPQLSIPIDETLQALNDLVHTGKVRYIGTSTFFAWQLVESLWVSEMLGLNRFVCEQPPYNILDRRIERDLLPMAQTYGFGIIPWSPLAAGILTGKYKRDEMPPNEGRYSEMEKNPVCQKRLINEVFDVVEQLEPLAEQKGCTLSQFAVAWCINQPAVTSAIIGPRTMEQLEDNIAALQIEITDGDREQVDNIVRPGRVASPFYEANFDPHEYCF